MSKPRSTLPVFVALLAGLCLVLLASCSSKPSAPPPTTATVTTVPTVAASPTAPPTLAPSPTAAGGRIEVSSTVQLIDVRTGTASTLYESRTTAALDATFDGDRVTIRAGNGTLQFGLDGAAVLGQAPPECREPTGSAEVAGRTYAGIRCGTVSPDRRWMTYRVRAGEQAQPSGYVVPLGDQWILDLGAGTTRLVQPGLVLCGGCDARYGPRWSPSGRYVAYAESGGTQRRFLTDSASGITRLIGTGSETDLAPVWSLAGDRLLYGSISGEPPVVEDLATGTTRVLELAWPVAFDRSGTLVYSPAWAPSPKSTGLSTTIADVASGRVVVALAGAPAWWRFYSDSSAVAATPLGVFAALQQTAGCAGTAIYLQGQLRQCVSEGVEGQVGPNGIVAVARKTGSVGPAFGPQFESVSIDRFDIDLVSPDGQVRTVARGALSIYQAPLTVWNVAGTHLLVLWPRSAGL